MQPNAYLTMEEIASILNVSKSTVKRHVSSGRLRARKIGRLVRIKGDDFERFVMRGEFHQIKEMDKATFAMMWAKMGDHKQKLLMDKIWPSIQTMIVEAVVAGRARGARR